MQDLLRLFGIILIIPVAGSLILTLMGERKWRWPFLISAVLFAGCLMWGK